MQKVTDVEKQLRSDKAKSPSKIEKQKTKISSMFNNDLFNALALYNLAHDLGFPPGFFKLNALDSRAIHSLKQSFPDQRTLDSFFKENQVDANKFPSHLVEKTTILGLFWKSYFKEKIWANDITRAISFKSANPKSATFLKAISEFRRAKKSQGLDNGESLRRFKEDFANFYEPNLDFFERLPLEERENEEAAFSKYWMQKGYEKYILGIFSEDKPFSIQIFGNLLNEFGIPLAVYHLQTGLFLTSNDCKKPKPSNPPLELLFDPETDDCSLVQTVHSVHGKSEWIFQEYGLQLEAYEDEVANVNHNGIVSGTCLFLAAALNPSLAPVVLCHILDGVFNRAAKSPAVFPDSPLVSDSESDYESDYESESQIESSEELSAKQRKFNEELDKLSENLDLLEAKILDYNKSIKLIVNDKSLTLKEKAEEKSKYVKAAKAATNLHEVLSNAFKAYDDSKKSEKDYIAFRRASMQAIGIHKPALKEHRDFDKIIANIIGAILGMIVIYAAVLAINYVANGFHNTMWHSEGRKVVDSIEDNLDNLAEFYKSPL